MPRQMYVKKSKLQNLGGGGFLDFLMKKYTFSSKIFRLWLKRPKKWQEHRVAHGATRYRGTDFAATDNNNSLHH